MFEIIKNYFFFYIIAVSVVAFFLYGIDKLKAKKHLWRIPEKVLLGISLLGGFFGGLLGMKLFHHKTKHWYFFAVNFLALILWSALGVVLYIL